MPTNRPVFVVSDLHVGDGGPRDNFAVGNKEQQFGLFLKYVAEKQGELVINGDLFEFWQANLSRVLLRHQSLLDRLADMQVVYVVGNHDADLAAFIGSRSLCHPFFERMCGPFERDINGRRFRFMHGHEVDRFNEGEVPRLGRVFSILAGMYEDAIGSPFLPSGEVAEDVLGDVAELLERLWQAQLSRLNRETSSFYRRICEWLKRLTSWLKQADRSVTLPKGLADPKSQLTPSQNPDRVQELLKEYEKGKNEKEYDIAIVGHTHQPGRRGDWYFNSGSWATKKDSFLQIDATSEVTVFDWVNGQPVLNETIL